MDCSQCQLLETRFDQELVGSKVHQYHQKGLRKETRILVNALVSAGVEGYSLLDVGGGLGALEFELLKAGVAKVTNVEASTAYGDAVKSESSRLGFYDNISHIHGNFIDIAHEVSPADLVTLDKVICCYDDMTSLVSSSVEKVKKLYGLVYPRDTWWVRAAIGVERQLAAIFHR